MLWNNIDSLGGKFLNVVESEFQSSNAVTIASGYVSLDIIRKFYHDFERIAGNGGEARLLVGMAFYEGLSSNKLTLLTNLHASLNKINSKSGVFVSYNGKYHGKLYSFSGSSGVNFYLGSSKTGIDGLLEGHYHG